MKKIFYLQAKNGKKNIYYIDKQCDKKFKLFMVKKKV